MEYFGDNPGPAMDKVSPTILNLKVPFRLLGTCLDRGAHHGSSVPRQCLVREIDRPGLWAILERLCQAR